MRSYVNRKISATDIKNKVGIENIPSSTLCYYRKKLGIKVTLVHPNKDKIIQALKDKVRWSVIKKELKCSDGTISRYKKILATQNTADKF